MTSSYDAYVYRITSMGTWTIELRVLPSLDYGEASIAVDGCNLILKVNNPNYFDYIKPACVKQVTYDGDSQIVTIHIDRVAIGHCRERWLTINRMSLEVKWHEKMSEEEIETILVPRDHVSFQDRSSNTANQDGES